MMRRRTTLQLTLLHSQLLLSFSIVELSSTSTRNIPNVASAVKNQVQGRLVSSYIIPPFSNVRVRESHRFARSERNMAAASQKGVAAKKNLVVDPFCFRQFAEHEASQSYSGTVFNISIEEFERIVNSRFDPANLKPGYAPFCKHIFLVNDFSDARLNVLPITKENEHALRTKYDARNEKELPVLMRFFVRELLEKSAGVGGDGDLKDVFPVAKYLDLILYSREQIEKENAAMGETCEVKETAPWGIVSIKAQDVDHELPMTPITVMRNALGKDQGGSGVPLEREAYMEAYEYWKDHAIVL